MSDIDNLRQALIQTPGDDLLRFALADALEEAGYGGDASAHRKIVGLGLGLCRLTDEMSVEIACGMWDISPVPVEDQEGYADLLAEANRNLVEKPDRALAVMCWQWSQGVGWGTVSYGKMYVCCRNFLTMSLDDLDELLDSAGE
jgi:hypothetical protein